MPKEAMTTKRAKQVRGVKAFSELADEAVQWVIPGFIPQGCLTLLVGNPGTAKSLLTQTWAGQLSRDGTCTLLLSAEDAPTSVIGPRLSAMQADKSKIHIPEHLFRFPTNIKTLRRIVGQLQPRLIVLDLLDSFAEVSLTHEGNAHAVIDPLIQIAVSYHLGILGVMHVGKTATRDIYRTLGSIKVVGLARSVILLEDADPEKAERRVRHIKCNHGALHEPLYFCVEAVDVGGGIDAPIIIFRNGGDQPVTAIPMRKKLVVSDEYTIERGKDGNNLRLLCTCRDERGSPMRLIQEMSADKLAELGVLLRSI